MSRVDKLAVTLPGLAMPADAERLLGAIPAALAPAVAHAWTHAPFLRGLLRTRRATFEHIAAHGFDAALTHAWATMQADNDVIDDRLRRAKADIALITALADLSQAWPLEKVTRTLSDFADHALNSAVAAALAERDAPNMGFVVLGLGKLGSHELNYSSDVDLILLYDPAAMPCRGREEPDEAAVRIAKRVVDIMQGPRPTGYVFRTDLRLRPSPEATAIALPLAAAEHYYQSEALTWERVAFIRARACAGDIAAGEAFLAAIRPFIWRRSLDYTAIRDIQSVSLRIRDHYDAGQAIGPGFDLKRGRGGIREVEFFAQIHQMIWGGRNTALRAPATLDALAALAAAGQMAPDQAAGLAAAYRWLRTIEHRLQMRADEQTHAIPTQAAARSAVVALCGFADWRSFEKQLAAVTDSVSTAYDSLITEAGGARLPSEPAALKAWLRQAGLKPAAVQPLVERWRAGGYRALRSEAAQARFEALLPDLLATLAASADPGQTAARFDSFLSQLPAGVQFFALLEANPRLTPLLGRLLGLTPVLANALARTPDLLDVLLGVDAFAPVPEAHALTTELRGLTRGAPTPNEVRAPALEDVLDRVRRWTGERRFQIGAQLIERAVDPLVAARNLADVADSAMTVLYDAVVHDFAMAHGSIAGGALIVLAMGRYGGHALTHASDLDLVYLFSGAHDAQSDGARQLAATSYFNRLAPRLTAALSVPTAAGALYEVDTRLRPSGAQGLLAVSVDSFARYQREAAWTWEHLALTRARVVAGPSVELRAVIADILAMPRDPAKLHSDVLAMRGDIDSAKPGQGLLDVKLGKGGLVDIEFITHYLQLRHGVGVTADLRDALAALHAAGHVPAALLAAHDVLTRLLVVLRLVVPDTSGKVGSLPPQVSLLLAQTVGCDDFAGLEAVLTLAKRSVIAAWESVFDSKR